jgi:hypothetical protein
MMASPRPYSSSGLPLSGSGCHSPLLVSETSMRAQLSPVRMVTVNSPPGSPAGVWRIALLTS